MTVFQTICLFILGLCVIYWMYSVHVKLDRIIVMNARNLYTILRILGIKEEDAHELAVKLLRLDIK